MAPVNVNVNNQEEVWNNLYAATTAVLPDTRKVFDVGDRVRLSQARQLFKKGYMPAWTEELFTISRVNRTNPIMYVLNDDSGEEVKGSFYKEEIQRVGDKQVYRIESVLQERRRGKGKEYLVKWFGYNTSFNSWISNRDISKYNN
jgi:hypothetical protein